jgi:hypothetical protein
VSQAVRRHTLGDAGGSGGLDADAVEVTRRERVDAILTGKQIALRPQHQPPVPQQFEQMRGQHCVAVLAPLCVRRIYVAMVAERQSDSVAPPFGGNITFAYESSECVWEADEG